MFKDGGRNVLVTTDITALEVHPGTLLRLTSKTSPEIFEKMAHDGDARLTAGHLVSLVACNRGVESTPLALLGNHVLSSLLKMHSKDNAAFHEGLLLAIILSLNVKSE